MSPGIRPMTEEDLEPVLAWRNHPDVRKFMFSRHEIALDEHRQWFEKTRHNPERQLLIFEEEKRPKGFINLAVATGGIAEWGFYADPDAPKGTGRNLGRYLLSYVFSSLRICKLVGQVLSYNERSRQFHLRLGFAQEGILRQQHFDGEQYHDIYSYGLLADEWQQSQGGNQ